jgi:Type II secretion system (T2SS), protein E, N-terminal domain
MAQRLAQHLISKGLLPARRVDEALRQWSGSGVTLDTILLELGAVSEAGMLQVLADVSGERLVNLADFEPNREAAVLLPVKIAQKLNLVPLSVEGGTLHLAATYPLPHQQLRELGFLLGKSLELWVAVEVRVRDWMSSLYHVPLPSRFETLLALVDPARARAPDKPREPVRAQTMEVAGVSDAEPIPLTNPRKKPKRRPLVELVVEDVEEPPTMEVDASVYAAVAGKPKTKPPAEDETSKTTVLTSAATRPSRARCPCPRRPAASAWIASPPSRFLPCRWRRRLLRLARSTATWTSRRPPARAATCASPEG